METKYIIPFIESTKDVCKKFLEIEVEPLTPVLFDKKENNINWDISGIIGLAGDIKGMVVIAFSKDIIFKIAKQMLGKEYKEIDDDIIDIVGELINIIAGNSKKYLDEFKIVISLPSVIRGSNHSFFPVSSKVTIIKIPFSSSIGTFSLFVYVQRDL